MGGFLDVLTDELQDWISQQHVFWVASAPLHAKGHVNVSPRGHSPLTFLDKKTCFWVEMSGSGNETISHMYENGRLTILFNAFEGPPRIIRLYGKGQVYERGSPLFEKFLTDENSLPGARAIIFLDIEKVGYSCGFTVPFMDYVGERHDLFDHANRTMKADEEGRPKFGMEAYWAFKNFKSIDGLPGLKRGYRNAVNGVGGMTLNTDRSQFMIKDIYQGTSKAWSFKIELLIGFLCGVFTVMFVQQIREHLVV